MEEEPKLAKFRLEGEHGPWVIDKVNCKFCGRVMSSNACWYNSIYVKFKLTKREGPACTECVKKGCFDANS